jgi:hypothetical protein
MAPPKDIARSYPKRGLTADVGFRSEPKFCGDGAATFPTTSDYAQTAASASLALGETYTLCAWVRSVKPDGANHVVNIGVSGGIKVGIAFFGGVSNPAVYAYNGITAMNTTGVFESDPHTWYHIAMVIKAGAGNSQIFINGIDSTASHSLTFPLSGSPVLHIGGDYSASNGNWQGDLANVALFTSSLTEDQVRQAMRASDYASHATIATLEAFYPLSSDFNDSTGNHNATASGSPEFRPNRPQLPRGLDLTQKSAQARVYSGRAVDFDGGADGLASTATLNINTSGAKATLACWVNPDVSTAGNKTIVSNAIDTTNNQFTIYQNGTSYAVSAVYASGFTKVNYFADSQVKVGAWTFLCAVWDFDTTSLTFYVDGASFTDTPSTAIGSTNGVFEIGCRDPSGSKSQLFDGQIASIKLFDTTLTQAQVRELYHNPEQVLPTGVSASNLKRYYPLSDYNDTGGTGGRYFQDMGADGEPAEDKGSALMSFAQPVPCPQLGLQQSATRLYFENNASVASATLGAAPGSACTMSAWVFVEDNNFYQYIFTLGTTHAAQAWFGLAKYNTTGKLYALQNSALGALSSLEMNLNEWNHLVIMTKSTAPYVRMFFNGVEDTSIVDSGMVAYNLTNANVYMGGNPLASAPSQGFSNDCAIWDVELSDSEVAALYNSGVQGMDVSTVQSSNLKGWWKCDDLTTLKDYSGNGANATVTGTFTAASFPENASGSTIVGDFSMKRKGVSVLNFFDDSGSTKAVIPAGACEFSSYPDGGSFSLFFRMQKYGTGSNNCFFTNFGTTATVFASYPTGNNIRTDVSDGTTRLINTIASPLDSEWHHLAGVLTYGSPASLKIYLDGVLTGTVTGTLSAGIPTTLPLTIGSYGGSFENTGPLACMRFYNTILSDNEIKQIYNSDLRLIKGLANE